MEWITHQQYASVDRIPFDSVPSRQHAYAPYFKVSTKGSWAPAMRVKMMHARAGMVIAAGHQVHLKDWPAVKFLCGGILIKENKNVSIITWEGNKSL